MRQYTCTRKCFFNNRLWEVGENMKWGGEGNPPRHFELNDSAASPNGIEEEIQNNSDIERETLKKQLTELKIPFDKRWGNGTLKQALINGMKDRGIEGDTQNAVQI